MKKVFTNLIQASTFIFLFLTAGINAQAQSYCATASSNTSDDWLANVTFAGIDNTSLSTTYSDFTDISGVVAPGISYEFSGTIGLNGSYDETITVYIDWDQSFSFEPEERYTIGTSCNTNGCILTGMIDVPATAVPGETRMRVIEQYSSNGNTPCAAPYYGEVEDYTINVQTGECTPPNFAYTIINDCEAETYTVSADLNDFGTSQFITVYLTRSDDVPVNPLTLIFALQGETVNLINDVPFGVTVSATISGSNPICDLTRNWAQLYCHIDGEVCDAPLVVSELPFTASGNTSLYLDDYEASDVPAVAPDAIVNGYFGNYYLSGDDVVYAYTPEEDGAIDISTTNDTYTGLWVFTGCPFESTVGYHLDYPEGTRAIDHLPVVGGTTYYIVISTYASPQSTNYTLSITPWEDCTGTPTAGTVGEDMMVCAATGFELVSTGTTADANGLIFTWQSSPVGADTWTDVDGANTPSYNLAAGITEDTDFRLKAYCTATDATDYSDSFTVSLNPNYADCYCIPTYSTGCNSGDDLSNVSLSGESISIDNTTDCSATGYEDFTDLPAADLAPGETYSISASTTYGSPTYEQVRAWIDYNLNGAFEPEEQILTTGGLGLPGGTASFNFTVPEGLNAGDYRLRVRLVYGFSETAFDACGNQTYGETQDYMVNIINLNACSGTPEAGEVVNDQLGVCANIAFTLNVTGASDPADGLTRIWQSSPAGEDNWTDIAGASTMNYTVAGGIGIPTDYRYSVTCANSNETDVSNTVQVSLNPATECYCTASSAAGNTYFLSSVTTNNALQDLNKTSGYTDGGYADYTETDTLIAHADQAFDFSLVLGTYGSQVGIWIDYNQNGSFTDEGENVILNNGYLTSLDGTLTMPSGIADGSYRMRIRTVSGTPVPCGAVNYSETEDYVLKIITLNECAGTPTAGTANDDFNVCAVNGFSLMVSGSSNPAEGLTRIWQSSPAGENEWSDIPEATSTNYYVANGISTPTDFRYSVSCEFSGESDYSNVVAVNLNPATDCYCTPTYTTGCDFGDDLSNVTLTGESVVLNNTTACLDNYYGDFTDLPAPDLAPGETYTLSTSTTYGSPTSENVKAWIDYNLNGAFEPDELIAFSNGNGLPNGTGTFSFVVPEGLEAGNYRLRVRLIYGSSTFNACDSQTYGEAQDYTVEIIELNACSGTPEAGEAANDQLGVCANIGFTLNVVGSSDPADGLTRIWQSSPAGEDNWTDIPGASATNYTVAGGVGVPTDYRYAVTCANSDETAVSNTIQVSLNPAVECYCIPTNSYSASYFINNVSTDGALQDLDRTSGFTEGGYADYTATDTLIAYTNQEFDFSVSWPSSTYNVGVWVDFNQNGSFGDADEQILASGFGSSPYQGTIQVPDGLADGSYRMRVRANYIGTPTACGDDDYAEAEDYVLKITTLNECAGTPTAGTASDSFTICPTNAFSLTVAGSSNPASGLERIWQSSPAGQNEWTDIAGATSTNYNVADGISTPTDYRYRVTCSFSDESDYSNVVEVSINTNVTECYCIPTTANNNYYITGFVATADGGQDIDNTGTESSLNGSGYSDYTNLPGLMASAGSVVDFTADVNSSSNAGFKIWIDWNQDGSLGDPDEVAYASSSYLYTHTGTFTIPANASGTYRLRIGSSYTPSGGPPSACEQLSGGEFEDYILIVSDGTPFDCPNLQANIGDSCDDNNPLTEDDVVTLDCECAGTPIVVECTAPELIFAAVDVDGNPIEGGCLEEGSEFYFIATLVGGSGNDSYIMTANGDDAQEIEVNGSASFGPYTVGDFNISVTAVGVQDDACSVTETATSPEVCETFDCPEIQANFGDPCDDGDELTENDVIGQDCGCAGTIIVDEFDCPELEANYGDACELADGMGILNSNCECVPAPTCNNFTYYLADHDEADGISTIYGVTLSGSVATMTYIATSEIEVHIAFSEAENQIYAVSKHTNSYRTLDPFTGNWGATVSLGADYGELTAATFAPNGKLLIGSQNQNAIISVNVMTNVVSPYDSYSPVTGGDLAFGSDGMLYLATRSGNGLYQNWPDDVMSDVLIGSVPAKVTGLAITATDELLVSAQGQTSLMLYNTSGSNIGSYTLELGGEAYTLRDGDMASGCNTGDEEMGDCDEFSTFYVNHGPGISGSNLYRVTFTSGGMANMTYLANVPYEAHIAFNADSNIVYLVNVDGSFVRSYDVSTDVFTGDLALVGDFVKLTAAHYNDDDGLLYIGDHSTDEIYSVDLSTGIATFYANGPVSGGDIVINDLGIMYLATRMGAALYQVNGAPVLVGSIGANVTGMALSNQSPNLMLSNKGSGVFTKVSPIDASVVSTYTAMLAGSPFTMGDGDMASGCADEDAPTPPVNPALGTVQGTLTAYPNPTSGPSTVVFTTGQTSTTLVEVYDMSGRNVATLFNQVAQQGQEYRLDFNGAALPNGVYIYRMTTQNETIIEKFMIAK